MQSFSLALKEPPLSFLINNFYHTLSTCCSISPSNCPRVRISIKICLCWHAAALAASFPAAVRSSCSALLRDIRQPGGRFTLDSVGRNSRSNASTLALEVCARVDLIRVNTRSVFHSLLIALRRAGVIGGRAGLHSALETRHSLAELLPYNGRQQSYQR
jgi:hypothetical protein